jgi:Domain of unknown function (DUF4112)
MNQSPITLPASADRPSGRAERIVYPENPRYRRIRALSVLMDQSIVLPSGYRIGLDPLLGLLPGIGDVMGGLISCYLVYEAARLGLRKRVLLRMLGNIAFDTLAGSVPVVGDIFDAAWKANMRNLRLMDANYHPAMPERSAGRIGAWILGAAGLLAAGVGLMFYLLAQMILAASAAFWHMIR